MKAHGSAINTLLLCSETLLATGDEDGDIKLWDLRSNRSVHTFQEHADYISDLSYNEDSKLLFACSGDGYLSCYSTVSMKTKDISEVVESEFNSVVDIGVSCI